MKFNWGTGILVFLIMFLSAAAIFIVFAMRQDVNLVHEDYYEKGVDYSHQMDVDARSAVFEDSIRAHMDKELLLIDIEATLAASIDSGNMLIFRPSNSSLDLEIPFRQVDSRLIIPKTELFPGRYILKIKWYDEGLEFQVDKTVIIE
jgi:hypothetical protein